MSAPTGGKGKKLVFVGETGVGKTCIIARFTEGKYEQNPGSTVGANYATKTIEIPELKQYLTFDIWDTAGQEKYKSLARIFFQGAKMAVLVYDITRRESFDSMKNQWYKELKEHGDPDITIAIAGNKSDLYDDEAVPEQEARDFAKSIGAIFCLTSAQDNKGIEELFRNIGKAFLDPNSKKNKPVTSNQKNNQEPKPKEQEEKENIKINKKEVKKKNEERKKKRGFC